MSAKLAPYDRSAYLDKSIITFAQVGICLNGFVYFLVMPSVIFSITTSVSICLVVMRFSTSCNNVRCTTRPPLFFFRVRYIPRDCLFFLFIFIYLFIFWVNSCIKVDLIA